MTHEDTNARFRTTAWTLVDGLRREGDVRREALDRLVRTYWPPVYAFIRRSGRPPEEASELTQRFFAEKVLDRRFFEAAERERGSLRSLVRASVRRFLTDCHRRERARGRGRLLPLSALKREETLLGRASDEGPEREFERRWALALLRDAVRLTERVIRAEGRGGHWLAFELRVLRPALHGTRRPPLKRVAAEAGFANEALAAAVVQWVKQRVRATLGEIVGETLDDPSGRDEELGRIREALR